MNANDRESSFRSIRRMIAVVSRVAFSLALWTLGAANVNLTAAQTGDHRTVQNLSLDRPRLENLQRWVNAGHDPWCRDAKLVATEALRRISSPLPELEPVSVPLELERSRRAVAVYTFHSVDGRIAYRITLRRYRWLLPVAGSYEQMIWIPERVETVTASTFN